MRKKKLLFICLGNICRSPAADGIMHSLVDSRHLADKYVIDSAGIGSWHTGQMPDPRMREHGLRHGYTFNHHARQISTSDFTSFDYIIVMDEENYADVTRLSRRTECTAQVLRMASFLTRHPNVSFVPDPYYGTGKDFDYAIELIEDGCAGLLSWLESEK